MAITVKGSALSSAANNIVSVNSRSKGSVQRLVSDHRTLGRDIDAGAFRLNRIEFPKPKDIKSFSSVNVLNTFGSLGGMLRGLYSSKLDIGGLVRGVFTGKGNKIGRSLKVASSTSRPRPIIRGNRIRLSGPRALGVSNSIFSGLDFSTGLSGNELRGSAAASSASGSLAGSLLSGAIGKSLVPVPGLGFVLAGSVGLAMGGLGAMGIASFMNTTQNARRRQEQKLEEGRRGGGEERASRVDTTGKQKSILNSFNESVGKFQSFVKNLLDGKVILSTYAEEPPAPSTAQSETGPGSFDALMSGDTFFPLPGGAKGTRGVVGPGQRFGAPREEGRTHAGLDMTHHQGGYDAPVVAYKSGKVIQAHTEGYKPGGRILVDHGNGLITDYTHISPMVKEGDIVYGGQQIAKLYPDGGNTHLHFGIKVNGRYVDPEQYGLGQVNLQAPLTREQAMSRSGSGASTVAGANLVGIELHADAPDGKSGLIASTIDPMNPITSALAQEYGSFPRGYRDLGAPNRGLNILEVLPFNQTNTNQFLNPQTRQAFVDREATRIFNILKNHRNVPIAIFAGHNDLTTGELGTSGTSNQRIGGKTLEQVFNDMVAQKVEQLARAAGLTNITYVRSTIANSRTDPNNNWNRYVSMRGSSGSAMPAQSRPQVQAPPAASAAPRPSAASNLNINYQTSYNQPSQVIIVNRPTVTMVPMEGSSSTPQMIPIPTGGGGKSSTVIIPTSTNPLAILNKIQEYRLT